MTADRSAIGAVLLGGASGLRSFSALAVLATRGRVGGRLSRPGIVLAAIGELVADKLPATPARVTPGPFAVRLATGAIAGGRVAGKRGAVSGAAASAAATVAGYLVRREIARHARVPDPFVGAAEDVLALGVALRGVRGDP
jgi:uncharacterized membrane protein